MLKVSILGATGYTGAELVRLLSSHPKVSLEVLTSKSYAGKDISLLYPNLKVKEGKICEEADLIKIVRETDLAFIALPHGHAVPVAREMLASGKKIIDLGADFRLHDPRIYAQWYGIEHEAPWLLDKAVYGLPELHRLQIKDASLVANPGCYPTSILLGLAPTLKEGLVIPENIVIDSKSGVSGAGRRPAVTNLFAECNDNVNAYAVDGHRHLPEIEQELEKAAGCRIKLTFIPHLIPMTRGILSTIYCRLNKDWRTERVREYYRGFYEKESFVRVLPADQWPHTKWVSGSNYCYLNVLVDSRTGVLIILSVIDNLVKGASGQAVQNMNIMFGFPETTALEQLPVYP